MVWLSILNIWHSMSKTLAGSAFWPSVIFHFLEISTHFAKILLGQDQIATRLGNILDIWHSMSKMPVGLAFRPSLTFPCFWKSALVSRIARSMYVATFGIQCPKRPLTLSALGNQHSFHESTRIWITDST